MNHPSPSLLLVYNADSGIINALMDAVHKQLSPETLPCSLCAITYGAVSMHVEWRRFLDSLPIEVAIRYKDDFEAAYPGHDIANIRLRYLMSEYWSTTVRMNNILDNAYADRADFAFGNYRYFPGRGRELFVEIRYSK